jgi:hypothetical protein
MSHLYDQIISQRGSFERTLARIPGFHGYLDKAARRHADRILRDYVAGLLAQRIERLVRIERKLLDSEGGLNLMSKTSSLKSRMQTYRDRVNAAVAGYSGFMEAIKVDAEVLENLYSFDEAQVRYTEQFAEGLDTLEKAVEEKQGIEDAINGLDETVTAANEAFSLREDVLTNLDIMYRVK